MSIRLLARELYVSQKKVEQLKDVLDIAPMEEHADIEDELRKARAQMHRLQRALDGQIGR